MNAKSGWAALALCLLMACGGTEETGRQEQSLTASVVRWHLTESWKGGRRPETIDTRYLSTGVEVAGLYVMTVRDYGTVCDGQPLSAPVQPDFLALFYVRDIGPMEVGVESDFGLSFHLVRPGQDSRIDFRGPAVWRDESGEEAFAVRVSGQFHLDGVAWRVELRPPERPNDACARTFRVTGHTLIPAWLKEMGKSMPGKH